MFLYRSVVLILILFFLTSARGGDRWQSYLKNDWNRTGRELNLKTLFYSGGWLGGMYLISHFDKDLNQTSKSLGRGNFKSYFNLTDHLGNAPYTVPLAAGLTGLTLTGNNRKLQDAAFTSLEAAIVSGLITGIGKVLLGRARPYEKKGVHDFNPFRGLDESFPSGHASTAFALITPWVYYYPGPLTYALLILPASTAIARMIFDRHWATDVLTGSLIGILVGYNLARWHKQYADEKNYDHSASNLDKMNFHITFAL